MELTHRAFFSQIPSRLLENVWSSTGPPLLKEGQKFYFFDLLLGIDGHCRLFNCNHYKLKPAEKLTRQQVQQQTVFCPPQTFWILFPLRIMSFEPFKDPKREYRGQTPTLLEPCHTVKKLGLHRPLGRLITRISRCEV